MNIKSIQSSFYALRLPAYVFTAVKTVGSVEIVDTYIFNVNDRFANVSIEVDGVKMDIDNVSVLEAAEDCYLLVNGEVDANGVVTGAELNKGAKVVTNAKKVTVTDAADEDTGCLRRSQRRWQVRVHCAC